VASTRGSQRRTTGRIGTPIDFVSFHAKGAPTTTNGHVRMGIAAQLSTIADGFSIIASYPELRSKPIVIGESDPNASIELHAGQACVVPKGEWHRVHVLEKTQLVHITPGPNGDHRPL